MPDEPVLGAELHAFLSFCQDQIPFHRRSLSLAPRGEPLTRTAWQRIPLMGKEDLRRGFPGQLLPADLRLHDAIKADDLLRIHTSSGTSDERVSVLYDHRLNAYPKDANKLWGLDKPLGFLNKTAVLTSPICAGFECHFEEKSYRERIRGRTLTCFAARNVFRSTTRDLMQFHDELCTFQPDILLANPAYATWVAIGLSELNVRPYSPKLILSSYQWLTDAQRAFLGTAFGCPVINYYSATDLGGAIVGYEDTDGPHLRLNDRDVFVETVPVPECDDDQVGHVVISTISNRRMPLVRYAVGDLGWVSGDRLRLAGRCKEALVVGRTLVTPRDIDEVMSAHREILFYSLVQADQESLTLRIVPIGDVRPSTDDLVEGLSSLVSGKLAVAIKVVDRIDLERSLKTSCVRSLCPPSLPV